MKHCPKSTRYWRYKYIIPVFIFILHCVTPPMFAQVPLSGSQKVWIYLDLEKLSIDDFVPIILLPRTVRRLEKSNTNRSVDLSNYKPAEFIRRQIARHTEKINFYSRCLNAYSANVMPENRAAIQHIPFVRAVKPVRSYRSMTSPEPIRSLGKSDGSPDFYGNSYDQLRQLNIPAVHDSGYTGQGIRIAIIDAGFYRDHEAFSHIIESGRLISERDFIYGDNDVQYDLAGDTNISVQAQHGTSVWSAVGAYVPDMLIGAAYGAEFLLAKTEIIASESLVEEDLMVAAIEWADEKGADIISSSVTYRYFDDPSEDYSFEELNGQTTNAAKTVNWAFERGIISVICAGNENHTFPDGGMMTPSDAFGALTVGAVNRDSVIAGFSSHGPTTDGRIKPELCALGVNALVAKAYSTTTYGYSSGTSFSTPLITGAVALLIEKYPNLSPTQIIERLKEHASRSDSPDNVYGWGIPNVFSAMVDPDSAITTQFKPKPERLYSIPNPAVTNTQLYFRWTRIIPRSTPVDLAVYNILGQQVWRTKLTPKVAGTDEFVEWDLKNNSGENVSAGLYIVVVEDGHTIIRGKCLVLH